MATIEKLPSGNFRARVYLPNGKRKTVAVDKRKSIVERLALEFERQLAHGQAVHLQDRRKTVADWAEQWQAARNVEPATAVKDASQIRTHVLPHWGDWPLQAIGRSDVQKWIKSMTSAGVGANTVTGAYHRFAAMMTDAVLEGLLPASPCQSIGLPKVVKPPPRWLTRMEYDRIQLALAVTPQASTWTAYVALGCFSGLRPGELGGLDVEHVDFDRSLVRVGQVMTRHGLRAYPKTALSARSVPFPAEVGDLLWRLVGDRGAGPVFTSAQGARVSETNFRNRVWTPALERAGIAYERPNVMRHTMASWLLQAGVPKWDVARMLGHSSLRLVDTYAHLAPDAHDSVRAAWAAETVNRAVLIQPTLEKQNGPTGT